jgi:hypothetical protein
VLGQLGRARLVCSGRGERQPLSVGSMDILTFIDVQDYNAPPLQGLDGEIYQAGTVDYHAAMTELLLRGFPVGGDAKQFFPAIPADKVAIGFLHRRYHSRGREPGAGLRDYREGTGGCDLPFAQTDRISGDDWGDVLDD